MATLSFSFFIICPLPSKVASPSHEKILIESCTMKLNLKLRIFLYSPKKCLLLLLISLCYENITARVIDRFIKWLTYRSVFPCASLDIHTYENSVEINAVWGQGWLMNIHKRFCGRNFLKISPLINRLSVCWAEKTLLNNSPVYLHVLPFWNFYIYSHAYTYCYCAYLYLCFGNMYRW